MKKVLVWIGGDLFNFPLTYYLKKKCDLEIYAIADVTFHLKTSVDRLIFEAMGFGMIIFVYFANFYIKKN